VPTIAEMARNIQASLRALANNYVLPVILAGAPTDGTSGTGAGYCGPGTLLINTSTGAVYYNSNTKASPTWSQLGSIAALASGHIFVGNGSNVGTDVAVSGDVSITNAGVTSVIGSHLASLNVGGTGVAGAASVQSTITKAVTAFSDTVAKAVFTVTVPNAVHAAVIDIDIVGVLGAGGAIGAGEASRVSKYQVVLARTAGVNVVATASSAIGGAEAHVAGAANVTSVVVTLSAITGAVGASNTFTINAAITKSGGASDNHTCVASARILNQNATGVTIA